MSWLPTSSISAPRWATCITRSTPGRRSADEIIIFDSTGTALQDVASAALAYERAMAAGAGVSIDLRTGS